MSLKHLITLTAVAVAFVAAPVGKAQDSEGSAAQSPTVRSEPAISSGTRTQVEHRRGDRWGDHRRDGWRHRRYYPRYYPRYSPFYGYPFSYGYPYGYPGYGYPYFGASAALYYHGYHPAPRPRVYTPRAGGSVIAQVQQELARAGFYRGRVDGVMGNGTRSAIRAYERANRLRVDGRIDQELLRSLGID
jgi:hypothetical protein